MEKLTSFCLCLPEWNVGHNSVVWGGEGRGGEGRKGEGMQVQILVAGSYLNLLLDHSHYFSDDHLQMSVYVALEVIIEPWDRECHNHH